MKITAVTQDQLILIDGVVAQISAIGGFSMERGEWAVHFDTELGVGHVEYLDMRDNQPLDSNLFNAHYAWLIEKHGEYLAWLETQVKAQAKEESQALAQGEQLK